MNSAFVQRVVLATLFCLSAGPWCEATLVIGVPNEEGMLIVSDRLVQGNLTGYSDDQKVFRLSPRAAVALTGSVSFSLGERVGTNLIFKERLDGIALAKSYFSTNSTEKFDDRHFARCMSQQLSNYFAINHYKLPSAKSTGLQFVLFRTTPKKECLTVSVLLLLAQTESGVGISFQCQQIKQPYNGPAQILAFGNTDLPLELRQGHDPRFNGLRAEPLIAKFMRKPPKVKKVQLAEARKFARKLMAEAAAKTGLLSPGAVIGINLDENFLAFK